MNQRVLLKGKWKFLSLNLCCDTDGHRQWAKFDIRTQMMKGLFFAEHAYRVYLQQLFSSFNADKIQYAELRPNFMAANSVSFIVFLVCPSVRVEIHC